MVEALRIMGIMTLSSPAQPASALRRVANASARSPGAAAGLRAVWDHCGTIRVQRRLMHDEASAGLQAIGLNHARNGGACYGRVRGARAAHHLGHRSALLWGEKAAG